MQHGQMEHIHTAKWKKSLDERKGAWGPQKREKPSPNYSGSLKGAARAMLLGWRAQIPVMLLMEMFYLVKSLGSECSW